MPLQHRPKRARWYSWKNRSSTSSTTTATTATTVVEVADGRENVKKRKTTTISSSQEERNLLLALNESIKRSIKVQKKVDRKLGKLINILLEEDKNQEIEDDEFQERVCKEEPTTIHHRYVTPNNNSNFTTPLRDTIENTTSMTALNLASTMSREKPSENTLDLWTILEEKLGFKCMDGTYHLPEIKNANAYFSQHPSFSSLPEMQSYILQNMFLLPWESKLNEGEKELVKYWVRTGNTTFPDETILSATSQSLPASFEPWTLLKKLGFNYEPSGSDSTGPKYIIPNVTLSNRIEGVLAMKNVLWFPSIEGVQEWCLRNGIPDNGKGDFVEERKQLKEWASNYDMLQVL